MTVATKSPAIVHGHTVHLRQVSKHYGRTAALTDIDLHVEPGQFLVLLGPSGSGKSTLIRTLAGVEHLDRGRLHLGGTLMDDGRRRLPPERRDLAMVFQDYALWPHLTAAGNVDYALRRRKLTAAEAGRRRAEALDRVGLAHLAGRYPHELSGGEQQRVALARAVVGNPRLLLFDEPLSNLDADLRERLRVEIATLTRQSGATAVYITHDQSEAFALADVIGVLDKGKLVQLGPPEAIYHDPATPFVARFTGLSGELSGTVDSVDGDVVRARVGADLIRAKRRGAVGPGDTVRVLVRPAAHFAAEVDSAPEGTVEGSVVDVAYRGHGYDHVVACGGTTLGAVFATHARPRGSRVRLRIDIEGCMAFAG
ncbi:ABC transporter ATP-binding protein [Amycolatopsis alkalitolerans]|uniref:ABC-type quaternary amine transporter n=1 Tax=Amycolatopsis alkalitolerans TaxID=2547244 RepID=A0A5C4LUN9_9PSEU|nr:ABC transporter ATP-binding protein [Amycolatopsis alkalitolerans]TNC21428.1 ABC transporter ATP-binding protein [Amycolatopsis alkalitolerans]